MPSLPAPSTKRSIASIDCPETRSRGKSQRTQTCSPDQSPTTPIGQISKPGELPQIPSAHKKERQDQQHWSDSLQPLNNPNFGSLNPALELSMLDPTWLETRAAVEDIIEYEFTNPEYLREAMYPIEEVAWTRLVDGTSSNGRFFRQGNRKLALVGDTVMKTVILNTWFWRQEIIDKLAKRTDKKVKNLHLVRVAEQKGIVKLLEEHFLGRRKYKQRMVASTVEAIIGAVWFDSGMDLAVMRRFLDLLLGLYLVEEHELHQAR